jgi:sugar lactone lactonase YvrE
MLGGSAGHAAGDAAVAYARHSSLLGSGMSGPNGLALDASGNLYESDYFRGTVTRVTPTGEISQYASGFSGPAGLAFMSDGSLLVACYESHRLERVAPGGGAHRPLAAKGLKNPVWPAVDGSGRIYLADYTNNRVAQVAEDGGLSTFASIPGVNAIAVDDQDTLWVTTWGGSVVRLEQDGSQTNIVSGLGSACGIAWSPNYLAVVTYGGEGSHDGSLLLVDFAGRTHPVASPLDRASSVIFDQEDNLYTANIGDTGLRMFSLD